MAAYASSPTLPRACLTLLLRFFSSMRRCLAARVGLVGRRGVGASHDALIKCTKRCRASARLRS